MAEPRREIIFQPSDRTHTHTYTHGNKGRSFTHGAQAN